MPRPPAHADHSRLGFSEAVTAAFDFLVSEHGFERTQTTETSVQYKSPHVFVEVYHDRPSLELGVEVARLDDSSRLDNLLRAAESPVTIGRPQGEYQFSLDEVARLVGTPLKGDSYAPFADDRLSVTRQVSRLAEGFKVHMLALLSGDREAFERLATKRSETAQKFTRDMVLSQLREQAERAWKKRDLLGAQRLFEEMESDLTPAERKKLDYARKHGHT